MTEKNKVICIQTFSGRNFYVRITEELWKKLTEGVEVFHHQYVNGHHFPEGVIQAVLDGSYPERMDFEVIAITPWKDIYRELGLEFVAEPPTPDYYISFSSIKS